MSSSAENKPTVAHQIRRASIKIAAWAVVLAGVYSVYYKYVLTSRELKDRREKITSLMRHDNPADYRQSAKLLDEGLALRDSEPWFNATRAEVAGLLWVEGGENDSRGTAERYLKTTIDMGINSGQRFDAEALALIGAGQLSEAEDKLVDVVNKSGGTAAILADLGIIHEHQGKLQAAKNDLKQATDRDWVNPRFGALYGEALFDDGDYGNAVAVFQKAMEGNPNHLRSLIGKARAELALQEHVADSTKSLTDILAAPEALTPVLKLRALVGKSEALLAAGDAPGAEAAARQALDAKVEGDSGVAYAQYNLGLSLATQKKPGALDAFKQAIALVGYIPHFYFDGAIGLAKAGQNADGLALLNQYAARITDAQGKMKTDDAYHRAKGEFLTLTNQLDDALKEYDLAIADNNVNADAYYRKGLVLRMQGQALKGDKQRDLYNSALEELDKAIQFRERFPDAYRAAGLIFLDVSPTDPKVMEKFTKALVYYKDTKAPKTVTDAFITEVEQRYLKYGGKFKKTAADWKKEATAALKP